MIRITRFHMLLISIIVIIAGIYAYQLVQEKERRRVMAAVEAQRQAVREAQQRMIEEERRRQELLNRAETLAIEAVAVAGEYRLISIKENKDVTQGEASLRQAKEFLAKRDFDNAWELAHQSIGQFKAAPVLAVKKAAVAEKKYYSVKKGDCLWKIAKMPRHYGRGAAWVKIWNANKKKIPDFDIIYPRLKLLIPSTL